MNSNIESSSYYSVLVILAVVLQVFVVSASTKYIDAICQNVFKVTDEPFCTKTLSEYPPAASASSTLQAAQVAVHLGISYAGKSAGVSAKLALENPNLKKEFKGCQEAFSRIIVNLNYAYSDLKRLSPGMLSTYEAFICTDQTQVVKNLVGKFGDKASKNVMMMTQMMDNFISVAVGATVAVSVG